MEEIVCPTCYSNQLSSNQKGFSTTNAVIGSLAGGVNAGIGMGMIGSNKIIVTCLKCGNQFKAGDGTIKTISDSGEVSYEKQVFVDKDKVLGKRIAIILSVLLFIIIVAIALFFNSLKTSNS
jgi:hypothetical protein